MAFKPEAQPKPPPAKTPPKPRAPKPAASAELRAMRTEGVNGIFQLVAAGLLMTGNAPDAGAIAEHGPNIARETASLAESNEGVARVVDYICAAGPYAGIIAATVPLALQIMVNHGRMSAAPLAGMGVKPPEAIMAKMQADALAAEADRLNAARESEAALRAAQARYDEAQRAAEADAAA